MKAAGESALLGGELCPLSAPRGGGAGQGAAGLSAGLPARPGVHLGPCCPAPLQAPLTRPGAASAG